MKKKINIFLLGVGAFTIILTIIFSVIIFYGLLKQEVFDELKSYANVLENYSNIKNIKNSSYAPDMDDIRITLVSEDGTVSWDTSVDEHTMDNHAQRPEVKEAVLNGEGTSIRMSATMQTNSFYYAKRLPDHSILRISKDYKSIWSVFAYMSPLMLLIGIFVFGVCLVITHFLVRSFIRPIEQLADNMDKHYPQPTYKELVPLIQTINEQHEDILKNARLRQDFTANVSHELKTPLTSISGYAELIENGMTNEDDVVRFATEIHRNSSRLLTMINDIIKLSELDVSDQEVLFEEVDIYEAANSCVNMLMVNARKNHVTLQLQGEHAIVKANKHMLEEVVYNLCDNAIRYNIKNGKVIVNIYRNDDKVVLSIKDNGIGISKENQERIFERFYRVDKSRSKSTGGTGLGLAIVKHIVAKLDATMELESEIGVGTEIKIILKLI